MESHLQSDACSWLNTGPVERARAFESSPTHGVMQIAPVEMNAGNETVSPPKYRLVFLIAGRALRSRQATANLRRICDEHLMGRVDLQIIDIREQPELARKYQVVAVPTLLKLEPGAVCRIIGDLSDTVRVLDALDLSVV